MRSEEITRVIDENFEPTVELLRELSRKKEAGIDTSREADALREVSRTITVAAAKTLGRDPEDITAAEVSEVLKTERDITTAEVSELLKTRLGEAE